MLDYTPDEVEAIELSFAVGLLRHSQSDACTSFCYILIVSACAHYCSQMPWGGEDVELDPTEPGKLVTGTNKYDYTHAI